MTGKRYSTDFGTELNGEAYKYRVREQKSRNPRELEEETSPFRVLEQDPRSGMELEQETAHSMAPEIRSWNYTYEALTHVHSLRLFLFNSMFPVPWKFMSLQATISSESSLSPSPVVLCQWVDQDGGSRKLFVPMPVCLIDYSAPLSAFGRSDHIEIKLKLLSSGGSFVDDLALLGFTNRGELIERDAAEVESSSLRIDGTAFSLDMDTELLTSREGVTFYCRNCSVQLIKEPIGCFRGLPSTEWRELADHWFGMCCSRDGVHAKSLMARFEEFLIPSKGVCLVGSTTCNVDSDDLVNNVVEPNQCISVDDAAHCKPMTEEDVTIPPLDDIDAETSCREKDGDVLFITEDSKVMKDTVMTASRSCHDAVEEVVGREICCNGSGSSHGNEDCGTSSLPDHGVKAKSPANGFMSSFPCSELTPVLCYNCSCLIGVSSRAKEEGTQLFKCRISSEIPTGGPLDIFRFHTLERVFSFELFSSAEEDSSYRYIVRDMATRLPLLQLVLINHESWTCSGSCLESVPKEMRSIEGKEMGVHAGHEDFLNGSLPSRDCGLMTNLLASEKEVPLFLEPVMKVMFCDTSSFTREQLSEVEMWGQKNQSDDIYMLASEVKLLARSLQANGNLFPESCAAFQQFHFSFLAK